MLLELRRCTGLVTGSPVHELIPVQLLPRVVTAILRNWDAQRVEGFIQQLYAAQYATVGQFEYFSAS